MRRFCTAAVLALGLGLLALVMAALPVVSAPSASQALPLCEENNPCGSEFQINIIPHLATQDDAIAVTYSAVWACWPTPMHQSHEVVGHVIQLDAIYYIPEVVLPVLADWGGKVDVGNLPTGTYRVDVYLTTVITPTVFRSELCGTRSFAVYEELWKMYLPIVAK